MYLFCNNRSELCVKILNRIIIVGSLRVDGSIGDGSGIVSKLFW